MEKDLSIISPLNALALSGTSNFVLIDARSGADAKSRYEKQHLKGALWVDLEKELSQPTPNPEKGGRHPLPDPETFSATLGKLGIDANSRVVVYDDKSGANAAARFWWLLKAAGHKNVQVLDGGLQAALNQGFPEASGSETATSITTYPVSEWKLPLVDLNTMKNIYTDSAYLIIDVRENYRFRGESEPIDLIAGHIPNSVNVPYLNNLDAEGKYLPPEKLQQQYSEVLKNHSIENVIVHCGSGVTACHTLLAFEHAGLPIPKLYNGSWSEWSRNELPVKVETED